MPMREISPTPDDPSAAPAAVYDRVIAASLDRIWENVLDWEHLPYLHAQSFAAVRPLSAGNDGWRAILDLPGGSGTTEVEVTLERPRLRYTTATVAGFGEGSRIVTTLTPVARDSTAIHVEFVLPWAPSGAAARIGEAYKAMYAVLWDQDEAMMVRRQQLLDGVGPVAASDRIELGHLDDLRAHLPLQLEVGSARVVLFEEAGELLVADLLCPHLGGPLEARADRQLVCPWHGYRFDARTGASCDGRSLRLRRTARAHVEEGGLVVVTTRRAS